MKRLLVLFAAVFAPAAWAAPFVVADVVAGVTSCGVFLDTAAKVTVPAATLLCKYDLATLPVGAHVIRMTAIATADPVWGTQESVQSAPLNFTKPISPTAPSTPRLSAQ
jgi:hypothetical protein